MTYRDELAELHVELLLLIDHPFVEAGATQRVALAARLRIRVLRVALAAILVARVFSAWILFAWIGRAYHARYARKLDDFSHGTPPSRPLKSSDPHGSKRVHDTESAPRSGTRWWPWLTSLAFAGRGMRARWSSTERATSTSRRFAATAARWKHPSGSQRTAQRITSSA